MTSWHFFLRFCHKTELAQFMTLVVHKIKLSK
jgi:hypothetical protein